jgi:hypothetical protein
MTKLVVIAVLALAALATADAFRTRAATSAAGSESTPAPPKERIVHPKTSSGFSAGGKNVHNRVLLNGREYLSPRQLAAAFPTPLPGALFSIAHLAADEDGTLVVAIYGFPGAGEAADGIEIWRHGRLESSFLVPVGTFGGGIGFAAEGRLVAGLSGDGLVVHLFTRRGRPMGQQSATSW